MIDQERLERIKTAYALAIRGNMEDKYRKGELIELPPQGDIVVLGDLHGNSANFQKIVKMIQLDKAPNRHLLLQEPTHTTEAREDKSFFLIEEIVELKSKYPDQVHIILGNHELSEIKLFEDHDEKYERHAITKGGICYNILFRNSMKQEYGIHEEELRELMINFMQTMPIACLCPNRIFISHSIPPLKYVHHYNLDFFRNDAKDPKAKAMIDKLVWGRDLTQKAADEFAKRVSCDILIVGHTACKQGFQIPNDKMIILDSKGVFATFMHFNLTKMYTHQEIRSSKYLKHLNPKEIQKFIQYQKEKEEERALREQEEMDESSDS